MSAYASIVPPPYKSFRLKPSILGKFSALNILKNAYLYFFLILNGMRGGFA
jgi:hypothetical protein